MGKNVTKHANKRIRERCGLPKKAVQRSADLALKPQRQTEIGRLKLPILG